MTAGPHHGAVAALQPRGAAAAAYSLMRNSTPSSSLTCSYVTNAMAIDGTTLT